MARKTMIGNKEISITLGPISRLPEEAMFEILVRISSVKSIALCKCKSWRGLISGPRFAKLHLARSKICVLVRNIEEETTLRTVYLLEDEDGLSGFNLSHSVCKETDTETECCEIVLTKLKIPVGPMNTDNIASTCDGLLCLFSNSIFEDSPIVVCNPVTGEFVTLPERDPHHVNIEISACGLGFDPETGRYKVVVLYHLPTLSSESVDVLKVKVHVLGTDSWRELNTPDVSLNLTYLSGLALLGGALHWVYKDRSSDMYGIVSFDLGSERLRYRSLPSPPLREGVVSTDLAVAALEDRLFAYPCIHYGKLDMCVVDESSVSDSLPEWISHDLSSDKACLQLICRLDKEALLIVSSFPRNELIYFDPPRGAPRFKRLRFADGDFTEIVAYTPSFIALEDILRPGNAQVLNVYSRNGKLVVDEDAHSVSVCEGQLK